jgi:hypothetical protein
MHTRFLFMCLLVFPGNWALSQATQPAATPDALPVLENRPDATPGDLLGNSYESLAGGISFRVPTGMLQGKKSGEEIARFINEVKNWELVATRANTSEPMPLSAGTDAKFQRSGLMEIVVSQIKANNPDAEIVRGQPAGPDIINVDQYQAGMIAARVNVGNQRRLLQQVIIQSNEKLYYTVTLTTPAAAKDKVAKGGEDPGEKLAVDTFRELVDSIHLLDMATVREDQEQRIFRTRTLWLNLKPEVIRNAIVPEQWLRITRDGKDVGYTYIIEEPHSEGMAEGVKVGMRSRMMPDENTQMDTESWLFVSFDRKHETWSNLTSVQDRKTNKRSNLSEIGSSDLITIRKLDKGVLAGVPNDPRQPAVAAIEQYDLTVTTLGNRGNQAPLKQKLPPYYLPQALGHMLPRVLPRQQPKTYMFYSYSSESGKVMARYVDVGQEQNVDLGGNRVVAVPVKDRMGLEGDPTTHYISPTGKYLGSINSTTRVTVLPSDNETLQKIWQNNANLTRPAPVAPAEPIAPAAPAQ